jgi:hypothetical protein
MKEHPIIFNGEQVKAVLDGRKTQHRVLIKKQPPKGAISGFKSNVGGPWYDLWGHNGDAVHRIKSPFDEEGMRLYVREAWSSHIGTLGESIEYAYKATDDERLGPFKSPVTMPREASRITLEITGVRVERLQDISEADAIAEGVIRHGVCANTGLYHNYLDTNTGFINAIDSYQSLWKSINGPGSWESNPFVWVIEFKQLTENKND